jgi:hypothetical protein
LPSNLEDVADTKLLRSFNTARGGLSMVLAVLIVSLVGGFSSAFASSGNLYENNYFFSFYQKIIN